MQTVAADWEHLGTKKKWMGMATDYDAPRKTDDDSDSIEALKERVPDKMSGQVDVDDADNPGRSEDARADGLNPVKRQQD